MDEVSIGDKNILTITELYTRKDRDIIPNQLVTLYYSLKGFFDNITGEYSTELECKGSFRCEIIAISDAKVYARVIEEVEI